MIVIDIKSGQGDIADAADTDHFDSISLCKCTKVLLTDFNDKWNSSIELLPKSDVKDGQ